MQKIMKKINDFLKGANPAISNHYCWLTQVCFLDDGSISSITVYDDRINPASGEEGRIFELSHNDWNSEWTLHFYNYKNLNELALTPKRLEMLADIMKEKERYNSEVEEEEE